MVDHGGVVLHLVEVDPLGDVALEEREVEGDVVDVRFLGLTREKMTTPSMKKRVITLHSTRTGRR